MRKATCSSAFKESAVERTRQGGWECHLSPEAPQILERKQYQGIYTTSPQLTKPLSLAAGIKH